MYINFGNNLNKLNHFIGRKLFKNDNLFTYNIYNFISDFKKRNNFVKGHWVENFHRLGYSELGFVSENLMSDLSKEIDKQSPQINDTYRYDFVATAELQKIIKKICYQELDKYLKDLSIYYGSKIAFSNFNFRRTYGFNSKNQKEEEFFSENWHCDTYLNTFCKLFINISDVDVENGPTHILSKKNTKNFIKKNKYIDRTNHESNEAIDAFKNTGKKGKILICNTTQCLHKAGIPEVNSTRDMLIVALVINKKFNDYFYFEKEFKNYLWSSEKISISYLAKKYSKPSGIKNLIKNLF